MCNGTPGASGQPPANLHEKICHATHGIPCRVAHSIADFFLRLIGRNPVRSCCGEANQAAMPLQKPAAGCGGKGGGKGGDGKGGCACGGAQK